MRPGRLVLAGFLGQLAVVAALALSAPHLHDAGLIEPETALGVVLGGVVGVTLTVMAGALALPVVLAHLVGRYVRPAGWYALAVGLGTAVAVVSIAASWLTPFLLVFPAAVVAAGVASIRGGGPGGSSTDGGEPPE